VALLDMRLETIDRTAMCRSMVPLLAPDDSRAASCSSRPATDRDGPHGWRPWWA
jgi:hypothetical protein